MKVSRWVAGCAMAWILLGWTGCYRATTVAIDNFERPKAPQQVTRIAVGSCNDPRNTQEIWKGIIDANPDVFVWMGDAVYPDVRKPIIASLLPMNDMNRLATLYNNQLQQPDYRKLAETTFITGTWDDHDYGKNDRGRGYRHKDDTKKLFLDFLGEPQSSVRRSQQGLFTAVDLGSGQQTVKILLTDNRYFRKKKGKNRDLLGEEQWQWLENELKHNTAAVTLFVSGGNITQPGYRFSWSLYPRSMKRLFDLLDTHRPKNLILLSGDKHFAELSEWTRPESGRTYFEMMTSGLTHVAPSFVLRMAKNPYRIGEPFGGRNFGLIRIDWGNGNQLPKVTVEVRKSGGSTAMVYDLKQ
jgi:alkaline phosphatase D